MRNSVCLRSFVGTCVLLMGVFVSVSHVYASSVTYIQTCTAGSTGTDCECTGNCSRSDGKSEMCFADAITGTPSTGCGCDCGSLDWDN